MAPSQFNDPVRSHAEEPPHPVPGAEPEFWGDCRVLRDRAEQEQIEAESGRDLFDRCKDLGVLFHAPLIIPPVNRLQAVL